jgi:hypothetical protein
MEVTLDLNKLLLLNKNKYYPLIIDFIKTLNSKTMDNNINALIDRLDIDELEDFFDIWTRVYFYLTYKINSANPKNKSYKIIKHYITKEKILIKLELEEL